MFCRQCGSELDDSDRFCPNCGASVSGAAPAPQKTKAKPAGQQLLAWRNRNAVYAQICISAITILILICFVFLPILKWDPNGIENEEELNYLPASTVTELMSEKMWDGAVHLRNYSVFMSLKFCFSNLSKEISLFPVGLLSLIICCISVFGIVTYLIRLISSVGQLSKLNENPLLPLENKKNVSIAAYETSSIAALLVHLFFSQSLYRDESMKKVLWYDKYFSGVSGWISVMIILWIACMAACIYKEFLTNKIHIAAAAETQTTDDPSSEETTAVQPPAVAMTQTAAYQIIRHQTRKSLLFRIAICLIGILFYISIMFIPLFKWNPNQANENELKSLSNKEQDKIVTEALINEGQVSNRAYSEYDELKMSFRALKSQHMNFGICITLFAWFISTSGIISSAYLLASLILQYLNLEDSALLVCHELKRTGKVYALEKKTAKELKKDYLQDTTAVSLLFFLSNTLFYVFFELKSKEATFLWYPTHFAGITLGAVFVALLFIGLQVLKQYNKKAYDVMKSQIVKNEKGD